MLTLEEIKKIMVDLGSKIGINKDSKEYQLFSETEDVFSEGISIYVDDKKYHYVTKERGQIIKEVDSVDIDDILYEIFKSITANIARSYEINHRDNSKDTRRIWFQKQLDLLDKINPKFEKRRKK